MQKLTQLIKPSLILENTTRQQCFGQFHDQERMCAVSVLNEVIRAHDGKYLCKLGDFDKYMNTAGEMFYCPCCHGRNDTYLGSVILHLNDTHKLSFKEIGMWLRNIGY